MMTDRQTERHNDVGFVLVAMHQLLISHHSRTCLDGAARENQAVPRNNNNNNSKNKNSSISHQHCGILLLFLLCVTFLQGSSSSWRQRLSRLSHSTAISDLALSSCQLQTRKEKGEAVRKGRLSWIRRWVIYKVVISSRPKSHCDEGLESKSKLCCVLLHTHAHTGVRIASLLVRLTVQYNCGNEPPPIPIHPSIHPSIRPSIHPSSSSWFHFLTQNNARARNRSKKPAHTHANISREVVSLPFFCDCSKENGQAKGRRIKSSNLKIQYKYATRGILNDFRHRFYSFLFRCLARAFAFVLFVIFFTG